MSWVYEIAAYADSFLADDEPTDLNISRASKLDSTKFGYLSAKDRLLLKHSVELGCDAFLTVEKKLPKNASHLEREIGIRVITPALYWAMLRPWAALWY